jgi:putative transposase
MKKRKRYPSDLTDKQWEQLKPLLPQKRTTPEKAREYIDAILYVLRTGGAWRMLPHDFPAWETVYTYFRKLERNGSWQRINDELREKVRAKAGREVQASVIIVDSQSVKTTEKGGHEATREANG